MAERKVLNKYIPPDFDPDKLMEKKRQMKKIEKKNNKNNKYNKKKKKFLNIRMMYPFTLKCSKCKAFTYVGTKFNSRVEKLKDETYLNIPIWQFYGKCSECRNEFVFKTDPKNGDYILIEGGIRTYDAHKEQEVADEYYRTNENGKEEDKVKNIEKQSYNALQELKTNEQLEELQNMNKRHIDKFSSINKALNKLYEKNEMENNKNNIFMNNLDSEDEQKFFDLLNKNRKIANTTQNIMNIKSSNPHVIIKEDEFEEEVVDIDEMADMDEMDGKSVNFTDKYNSINKKEENGINNNVEKDKISFKRNNITNNTTGININNKSIFSKKPLETHYKFIIKKKENISTLLNEYNSDSSDDK